MYNEENMQFIFKTSFEKVYNFYFDNKMGLCFCNLSKNKTWVNLVSLQKTIYPQFFVDMDSKNNFHIIFQDDKGNVFYSTMDEHNIKTIPILQSKSVELYNKNLFLSILKKEIHFFYILKHNQKFILSHQVFDNTKLYNPQVIDYIQKDEKPYTVLKDKADDLYVFYKMTDNENFQIGYKKYISSKKVWGEFIPITRFKKDSQFPSAITDIDNIVHICYQRSSNKEYEILYQQKIPDKNIWTTEKIIHSSMYDYSNASIVCRDKELIIFWVRDDNVYFSISSDKGNTWNKPAKYSLPASKQLMCMAFKSNDFHESGRMIFPKVPGNYINGFKLAFYSDRENDSKKIPPDQFKDILIGDITVIKDNIESLKEAISDLRNNIFDINFIQNNFEKDIIKCTVKVDILEQTINKIKNDKTDLMIERRQYDELKHGTENKNHYKRVKNIHNHKFSLKVNYRILGKLYKIKNK